MQRKYPHNWPNGIDRKPLPITPLTAIASQPMHGSPGVVGPDVAQRIIERLGECGLEIVEKSNG
jgi:hypothetical protein